MVKNLATKTEDTGDRFDPWVGKIPWSRKWQPTRVFLPGGLQSMELQRVSTTE